MSQGNTPKETVGKASAGQKMWGGRFSAEPGELMQAINVSIDFDRRLAAQDIAGSKAHSDMLSAQAIITTDDRDAIHRGLDEIAAEIENGSFPWSRELEDIHLLLSQAARNTDTIMPGFTHLQNAQPVTFGHHMLAYLEMFTRDRARLSDCRKRMNESPLGAAALAGTPYPIDRDMTAKALDFDHPMANSLDAVSARDFALEALSAATICATHLSRLSEEIVIWTSAQFNFVTLTDAFTTGSSIMPQKRNPDAAELIRAKVGRIMGAMTTLTIVMKGLPLAYSKDMQEDKEPVFDAFEALSLGLAAMAGMVKDMSPNKERLAEAAGAAYSTATDLADWLVRSLNMPFRDAHHVTGTIVALAEGQGKTLDALTLEDMQSVEPRITEDVYSVLSPLASASSRVSYGGTAPSEVAKQVARWQEILG